MAITTTRSEVSRSLLWEKYPVYTRGEDNVVFDPVSLESVFLSAAERAAIEAHPYSNDEASQLLSELGFGPQPDQMARRQMLEQRLSSLGISGQPARISGYRVVVTDKCNMKCTYCFVDTNTGNPDLTEEDLKYGLDFLLEQNQGQSDVTIQWFGGEPTIRFDLMKLGAFYAAELAEKYGVGRVQNTVVTNGVRITDEMISHFQEYRYGVGVSFDGPPDTNSSQRILLSGKPADVQVHKNIRRLLDAGVYVGCNLTPTAQNVARIPEIVDYVFSLGIRFIYVNTPIPAMGRWPASGTALAESLFASRLKALSHGGMLFSSLDRIYQALDTRRPKVYEHLQREGGINAALLPGRRVSICDINWRDSRFIYDIDAVRAQPTLLHKIAKELMPVARCQTCPAMSVCGGPSRNDVSLQGKNAPDPQLCAFFERGVELALWDNSGLQ